ncbi:MAG: hypothetical protein P4M11_11405 [Candidatus Pacebacteria bacterium]|nr:hypothetical protein [Candidatus Paceibacterota bacterium]
MDRNSVIDFVERLRAKPEHVRHRIALGSTLGITGVIAAGWLLTVIFSGGLAIPPSTAGTGSLASAPGTAQVVAASQQTQSSITNLLGAVGFANATTAPASLTVVDTATATPSTDDTGDGSPTGGDQSVIPF